MFLPGTEAVLESVGVLPQFPGTIAGQLRGRSPGSTDAERVADLAYWPSQLYLDAPQADLAAVEAAAIELQPFALVTGREETFVDAPATRR